MPPHTCRSLFARGLLYVSLQAAGVSAVAAHHAGAAFVVGFCISYVWSGNVHMIALSDRRHRVAYATGAAVGMVLGMFAGKLLTSPSMF